MRKKNKLRKVTLAAAVKHLKHEGRKNGWNLHKAGTIAREGDVHAARFVHKMDYPEGQKPLAVLLEVNVRTGRVRLEGDMDPISDQFKLQDSAELFRKRKQLAAQVYNEGTDIDAYEPQSSRLQSEVPAAPDADESPEDSEPAGDPAETA